MFDEIAAAIRPRQYTKIDMLKAYMKGFDRCNEIISATFSDAKVSAVDDFHKLLEEIRNETTDD